MAIEKGLRGDWLGVDTETDDQLLQMAAVNIVKTKHNLTQHFGFAILDICVMFTHRQKQHRATGTLGDGNISNGIMLLRDTSIPFQAKSKTTHPHICC